MVVLFGIVVVLTFYGINCDSGCHNLETCGSCISYTRENCVWCPADDHKERRCQSTTFHKENGSWCGASVYSSTLKSYLLSNDSFNSGEGGKKVVQILPQKFNVTMRPGVNFKFTMSYKPAKDYPLDVYYLMDYSYTMRGYKAQLENQGLVIYKELRKLTNNVQMGIGSFVEKPALPYAGQENEAFSFRNRLSLTQNMTLFETVLKENLTGSNYDDPEAGLDALMQVMMCQRELGWREKARRIIVLATDSTYHSAGDGKFVGAVRPHDMKCHLKNDNYNMSLVLDYPSVSQINKVASEHNFKIIFTAISKVKRVYEGLASKIRGATFVELKDNSNLTAMIKNEYTNLIRSVQINIDAPTHIHVSLEPDCRIEGNCALKYNGVLSINATLKVQLCPKDKTGSLVRLGPVALNEKLTIHVQHDCECECERNVSPPLINTTKCSGNGIYQCGICKCNENKYGDDCRCEGTSTSNIDLDKCKMQSKDTTYCNGRGTCSCGKCVDCQEGFSGDFCQYDDNACASPNDMLCSGMGKCRFGKCECEPGRTGAGCECPTNNDSCFAPSSKEMCSGNGKCVCGECTCLPMTNNRTCSGRFCDICDEFAEKRCLELEDLVECYRNANETNCGIFNQTSSIEINTVDYLKETASDTQMVKWCRKQYENGTTLIFKYFYSLSSPNTLRIDVQKDLQPPYKVDMWLAVGVPFGALILIGILTIIIWKILVDIHDAREYKNFREKAKADGFTVSDIVNPCYRAPYINVPNPSFNRQLH